MIIVRNFSIVSIGLDGSEGVRSGVDLSLREREKNAEAQRRKDAEKVEKIICKNLRIFAALRLCVNFNFFKFCGIQHLNLHDLPLVRYHSRV
jgi:hypothetical protein